MSADRHSRGNGKRAAITPTGDPAETIELATERLRAQGRDALGVTGKSDVAPLRQLLGETGTSPYPLFALGLLVAVDQLQSTALTILGPEITASLGIPRPAYAGVILLKTLVVSLAALPLAALVQRRPRRAAVCITTAYCWALLTASTGFVVSTWGLVVVALAAGVATASVRTVHQPLLLDSYPPQARVRILSAYRAFDNVGDSVGPLIIGITSVMLFLTWRGVFLALALAALGASVLASRLRDPGFGVWDTEKVREVARSDAHINSADENDVQLGFFEIARRLFLIPTVRRSLVAVAVLGMFVAPFVTYLAFFLQERWSMGPGARSAFFAVMPLFGIVALRIFGSRGEALFRRDPAKLVRLSGWLLGGGISTLAIAVFAPNFALMALLFGIAIATITVIGPAIALPMFSVVPAEMRPHLGALHGLFLSGVGGMAGLLLLSGFDRRFGTTGAILSLAMPGVAAGLVLRSTARTVNADLDRMIDSIVEEEEVRGLIAAGTRLPMLVCRGIDFSYGQLQVLHGVNFTVDEGEMVALLGVNGAGKSTLLRAISGIGLPSTGTVRFRGQEITYLDAERRVRLGITQVPGGRAVFRSLTVAENLRSFGYTLGRDRNAVERAIDECFSAFPRLAERRDQNARTLSGGEQQMLGLSRALMLRPQLLLIDELSLGLAPVIVGQLLEMVRRINDQGTAVLLVEQSVNVALSLVDHAYFMEKGEMRFDGRAEDLLARGDLLRAVFLNGTGAMTQR